MIWELVHVLSLRHIATRIIPSSHFDLHSDCREQEEQIKNESKKKQITERRRRRRRAALTQVVPPAPIAVVVAQQYPLHHLQFLELSIDLQVSFRLFASVIVSPQQVVSGTVVTPGISSIQPGRKADEQQAKLKEEEEEEEEKDIPELSTSP
jgi:hypothetical protein